MCRRKSLNSLKKAHPTKANKAIVSPFFSVRDFDFALV